MKTLGYQGISALTLTLALSFPLLANDSGKMTQQHMAYS